jgi:chromosome segregation ATPase
MPESKNPQRRLDRALARIEAASTRLRKGATDGDALVTMTAERDELKREIASLRGENTKLASELKDAKDKTKATQSSAGQIAKRLDGAMDQLKLVLDN